MLMKKLLLTLAALLITLTSFAFPKAFYVVKGDSYTKYNFGVAGDLKFSADGKTLSVTGYDDAIILDEIDYITFTALSQNLLFTVARNLPSNFDGALGYWAAYGTSSRTITIP